MIWGTFVLTLNSEYCISLLHFSVCKTVAASFPHTKLSLNRADTEVCQLQKVLRQAFYVLRSHRLELFSEHISPHFYNLSFLSQCGFRSNQSKWMNCSNILHSSDTGDKYYTKIKVCCSFSETCEVLGRRWRPLVPAVQYCAARSEP
jgi:hypothetical protein